MRVLLDENLPIDLGRLLAGHDIETVSGLGWDGVKNGELLVRMRGRFEALVTVDRNLPHQQNLAVQPFGVVLVEAPSNRRFIFGRWCPRFWKRWTAFNPASSAGLVPNLALKPPGGPSIVLRRSPGRPARG